MIRNQKTNQSTMVTSCFRLVLLLAVFFSVNSAFSQCTVGDTPDAGEDSFTSTAGSNFAQSFASCATDKLQEISMHIWTNNGATDFTIDVFDGNGTTGTNLGNKTFSGISNTGSELRTLDLSDLDISFTEDQLYTVRVTTSQNFQTNVKLTGSTLIDPGNLILNNTTPITGGDLSIEIEVGEASSESSPSDISGLQLWLDAADQSTLFQDTGGSTAVSADDQTVSRWNDKSGNGNHATVLAGQNGATYNSDASNLINGKPVLKFNGISGTSGTIFETGVDVRSSANSELTIFTVYRPRSLNDYGDQGQAIWGNDNGAFDRFFYNFWSGTEFSGDGINDGAISLGGSSGAAPVVDAGLVDELYTLTAVFESGVSNGSSIYFDGEVIQTFTDNSDPTAANTQFFLGWDGDNSPYDGDIAEIILYNRKLDACEIATVNLYLGDKYGRDFSNIRENFGFNAEFPDDINGIGVFVDDCSSAVRDSVSVDIVTIENPSSNDTVDEFLTLGHDNGGPGSATEVPDGVDSRLTQRWRIDEDGDLGTVDVSFDLSELGIADDATADNFVMLIDTDDGDFSNATSITSNLTFSDADNSVTITDYDFSNGDYFTLGTIEPAAVSINSPAAVDEGGTITFTITSSKSLEGDMEIAYTFADVSTSGADFTSGNTSGVATIAAGANNVDITVVLASDGVEETEETFTITLSEIQKGLATISSTQGVGTGTIAENLEADPTNTNTTITASPATIIANGSQGSKVTVQLAASDGTLLSKSGGTVALSSSLGTVSAVVDNEDGTYTASLSSDASGNATVSGTLDGAAIASTAEVTVVPVLEGVSIDQANGEDTIRWCSESNIQFTTPENSGYTYEWFSNVPQALAGSEGYTPAQTDLVVKNGVPYVSFTEAITGGSTRATLLKYNSGWESVGNERFSDLASTGSLAQLAFDGNTPYVAIAKSTTEIAIYQYNGATWETHSTISSNINGNRFELTFDDKLYVQALNGSGRGFVYAYNGTSWEIIGGSEFSDDCVNLDMHVEAGVPYVSFADRNNTSKATVKKYNGTAWETVGAGGISSSFVSNTAVTLLDGTPYVAFSDGDNARKVTVMKFNGTSWDTVGSAGISEGQPNYLQLAVDDVSETLYVAYTDNGNDIIPTVQKYNGSSWELIGQYSRGDFMSFDVHNDTPYMALRDYNSNTKLTLLRFGGDISVSTDASLEVSATGTYILKVTDTNTGAIGYDTLTVVSDASLCPNLDNTTISADPSSLAADGTTSATITVQLVDENGDNIGFGSGTVVLSTTLGTLSTVTDNNDGTYTATITSTATGTATITGTLDGSAISDNAEVEFTTNDTDDDGILDDDEDRNGDDDLENDDCDGDGTPDYKDPDPCDSDDDGLLDPEDTNGNGDPYDDDCDGDGIPNFKDADPCDTDDDGINDDDEDTDGDGDPTNDDCDGDGTPNYQDTDPCDSDDDGLLDPEDTNGNGDPYDDDCDGDGIPNFQDSDPCDTDDDGINDDDEDTNGDGDPTNDDCDGDGTPNYQDADPCDSDDDGLLDPEDTNGNGDPYDDDCDGDGIPNFQDADPCDSDDDGINDEDEDTDGDGDPTNDDCDGDGTPNYQDADPCDSDDDGLLDPEDTNGNGDPYDDDCDGDGIPNFQDADSCDSDDDGINDEDEDTDGDGDPTNDDCDGDGTPNYQDADPCDSDGDGLLDPEDTNGNGDPYDDDCDGDGIPNFQDADPCDTDDDGINDDDEDTNGNGDPYDDDCDGDGIPNFQDSDPCDTDDDGINDDDEDTNGDGDPTNDDCDGDGTPNYQDADPCDSDGDGLLDPEDTNGNGDPYDDDCDGDGIPNFQDSDPCDTDDDGINDDDEDTNGDGDPTNDDCDGDGTPNYQDADPCDSDGDGINDEEEDRDGDGNPYDDDCDGDGTPDFMDADPCDTDDDGLTDEEEDRDGDGDPTNDDCDGDGTPDYLDADACDTDSDGLTDEEEDVNGNGDPTDDDTDGDGIPDYLDEDDDGDGLSTKDEDINSDGDPTNDDSDEDGIPDYLDADTIPSQGKIPQGISPDGDGANDAWMIPGIEKYPNNKVVIFSRWGNKIYETRGYDNGSNSFNGTSNNGFNLGSDLPDGTYYYVVDFGNGTTRKGYLIIKR